MTGKFSDRDPARCAHYAGFMSHLTLLEANLIFWGLFVGVIVFLCIASVQHHKSIALSAEEKELPAVGKAARKRRNKIRRLRLHFLSIASLCAVMSATCTVFEVFALFSIQFCGGEDLMMIYWGFWSVLQVGSNIAILGVMLQFWIVLGDVETPSWAVALGTPVLVFAALGFVIKSMWAKAWARRAARKDDLESSGEDDEPQDDRVGEKQVMERTCTHCSNCPTIVQGDSSSDTSRVNSSHGLYPQQIAPTHPHFTDMWSRDFHYVLRPIMPNMPGSSASTNRN